MNNVVIKKYGHTIGFLYLIIIVCGLFSEMFVRGSIIIPNDTNATIENIADNLFLFRFGFVLDLIMAVCDVAVAVLFYRIFNSDFKLVASITSSFRFGQAIIIAGNLINHFAAILLVSNNGYGTASILPAQVGLFLNLHTYGYLISGVFFGISCAFLGYLFIKSPYFPSTLGKMILAASVGYLTDSFVSFLLPEYADLTEILVMVSAIIAELSLCFWLLIKGAKTSN